MTMDTQQDVKRFDELALRAARRGEAAFTHFLDLNQIQRARMAAGRQGVNVTFCGGYENAERCMAAFYADEAPQDADWPIQIIRISWRAQFGSPTHRDLLGALMALGFEREKIGDIALDSEQAYLFAESDMADYIASSLTSAGRVTLRCEKVDSADDLPEPEGREIRAVVSSLRLDAVLAAAFSLSRAEAARLINQGKALVNQAETLRVDHAVPEHALLSLRGMGRVRLDEIAGETKKGRIALKFFVYGK